MAEIIRYAGFANDPTPDAAAPAAVFHVDIASASLDAPTDTQIIPPTSIGREARTSRPGFYAPSGGIEYAFDIASIPRFLRWALGGYAFTTSVLPALRTHEMWGQSGTELPMFAARIGKDLFEHVFRGCVMNSIELAVEGEFAMCRMDVAGRFDAKAVLLALEDLLIADEYPLAFHEVTATRDAADYSAKVKSLTLAIANNSAVESGRSIGSRHPRRIPSFERDVRLNLSLYYDSTAELEAFWGDSAGPSALGPDTTAWTLHFDAGADGEMDIALPNCNYMSVPTQPSGRDEITQDVGLKAFQTTHTLADAVTEVTSSILATVQNSEDDLAV